MGKTEFLIRLLNIGKILTIGKISKNNKIFPLGKKDLTIGKKRNSSNEYNLIRLLGKIDLTIGKKRLILEKMWLRILRIKLATSNILFLSAKS